MSDEPGDGEWGEMDDPIQESIEAQQDAEWEQRERLAAHAQSTPSPLTREQVERECQWLVEEHCTVSAKKWLDTDAALRATIEQRAQEIARLKDKWAERRANLIEYYEGEIARLEGELESHAWEISPAMAQAKIDELNQQLAAMTTEREAMRDKTDFYKAEIDRADVLLNRFGIPNIAHECGDMLKPVDERIELVFVQMDVLKQQVARLREAAKRLLVVRSQVCDGVAVWATEWDDLDQVLRETGA